MSRPPANTLPSRLPLVWPVTYTPPTPSVATLRPTVPPWEPSCRVHSTQAPPAVVPASLPAGARSVPLAVPEPELQAASASTATARTGIRVGYLRGFTGITRHAKGLSVDLQECGASSLLGQRRAGEAVPTCSREEPPWQAGQPGASANRAVSAQFARLNQAAGVGH